ncbi:MAG: DUF1801 domain-containing protein [Cytophagaceae bacterium]|nr:MAG: DUF1801 domain-containing protein [Cytophagaceae bacterium]
MGVSQQIEAFLATIPEPKRSEFQTLHQRILQLSPGCRLWYSDGKDESGKVVANPTIGYGSYTIHYANGSSKESFRIGLSANTTGISVYILGIDDKTYLAQTFGAALGKASVTGYCIKFKTLKHIELDVLEAAIRFGFNLKEMHK